MKHLSSLPLVIGLLAAGTAAGCDGDHGPTTTQAGNVLKQHITSLASGINARDINVTQNEMSKEGCSKNKEKYLYSIKAAKHLDGGDAPDLLVTLMTGHLSRIATYEITKYEPNTSPTTALHDKQTHTNLVLSSPGRAQIVISGATDCLNPK
jgi:hypothetical protein